MIKKLLLIFTIIAGISFTSCRSDFDFIKSTGQLEFSQDTIFLDTVFTNIGSSTRTFKVYNKSNDNITIPRIALGQGENSRYRLAVDGVPGKQFENVELLAKDSLFVFVETTVDIMEFSNGNEFLYTDQILFDAGPLEQKVELVTLVKDAIFLFPERDAQGVVECLSLGLDPSGEEICIPGFVLEPDQLTFTNNKPYVIYGFAAIPNNQTLTIEAGARIHFHEGSGILASDEASLVVNGSASSTAALENEVIFQGDRLEPAFNDVAGQWIGIWLTSGSKNNSFNYATIKNASVGIIMDNNNPTSTNATLTITNSQIYNCSNNGILATTADIVAENVIIANAGQSSFVARLGGKYNLNNCTIANYWESSFRQDPVLFISNTIPNTTLSEPLLEAKFTNCIIYGDRNAEINLINNGNTFNFKFENSLIKFDARGQDLSALPQFNFTNAALYQNCVFNTDPKFENPDLNRFRIDNSSGANGLGNTATVSLRDLLGSLRSSVPDAGAYESVNF